MATVPFPGVWSPDSLFTGNSVYVVDTAGVVWLAANSTPAGAALYRSNVGGTVFTLAAAIPDVSSPDIAFDPAMAIDSSGNLHILGQVDTPSGIQLQKFTYNTSTGVLTGAFIVSTGGIVGADYDIVSLSNGNCYLAVSVLSGTTEVINGIELNPSGGVVHIDPFINQELATGLRYGSVSLWSPDGVVVEIYFCYEAKALAFTDTTVSISRTIRTNPSSMGTPTVLTTFQARFAADRLTVIGVGTSRYITQCFYTQRGSLLVGSIIVGRLIGASGWDFQQYAGTSTASLIEPTLSIVDGGALDLTVFSGQYAIVNAFAGTIDPPVVLLDTVNQSPYTINGNSGTLTATAGGSNGIPAVFLIELETGNIFEVVVTDGVPLFQIAFATSITLLDSVNHQCYTLEVFKGKLLKPVLNPTADPLTARTIYLTDPVTARTYQIAMVGGLLEKIYVTGVAGRPRLNLLDGGNNNIPYALFIDANKLEFGVSPDVVPYNIPASISLGDGTAGSLVLALIEADLNHFGQGGTIKLYNLDPIGWVLTPRTDFPYPATANWLRGAKSTLPVAMAWGFLGELQSGGLARFYTGFNAPPVANLLPVSQTAQRGTVYRLDASGSSDINLNAMTYGWTLTDPTGLAQFSALGAHATMTLPKSAGPAARVLTVTVAVRDVDSHGAPFHSTPSTASSVFTYPFIPAPVIGNLGPITTARNTQVNLSPVITLGASATYLWQQISGTVVAVLTALNLPAITLQTNGVEVGGETLVFSLTVSDGINSPVTNSFSVVVPARVDNGDVQGLARTTWTGNISQRNTSQPWSPFVSSNEYTHFTHAKRSTMVSEAPNVFGNTATLSVAQPSYIFIGPYSVLVQRGTSTHRVLTPDPSVLILDAVHAFLDQTLVLTSSGVMMQFFPGAANTDTDYAHGSIDVTALSGMTFTSLQATPPFGGARVIALTGPTGCLLLQINSNFEVTDELLFTANEGHLYGSSNVLWVRLSGVESLHVGKVLVGSVDQTGNTYETEISLASHAVLGVWDRSSLRNQFVTTGEILYQAEDSYSGLPVAPVLATPTVDIDGVHLSWTVPRPDLITQYVVSYSTGGSFIYLLSVGSGSITTAVVPLPSGTYSLRVIAYSLDGHSPQSNVVTVTL